MRSLFFILSEKSEVDDLRIFKIFLLVLLNFVLFGCNKVQKNINSSDSDIKATEKVDFDLSSMKPNMVYAQVFDMLVSPETYENKIIRMKGNFEIYDASEFMGKSYAVIIYDALACCQQGIEFRYDFGENFPEKGSEITVTGKFVLSEIEPGISYNFVQADFVEF